MFLSMFLLAFTTLHAQAPAAGTTVSLKMIDTVNSSGDPAGKQYRASVTTAVTAANGIAIARGAAATVTLTARINRINALQTSFFAFLQKKYGYKDSGNYPVDCRTGYPPTVAGLQNAEKYKQQFEDEAKQNRGQIVETGWKDQ